MQDLEHKQFAVIVAVAVAGAILVLGILSGISSAAAAGKTVKTPYVSKTVKMTFTAKLTGSNAIPPVNTPATGTAYFELSSNGKVLNYHLSTTNLKGFKEAYICEKEYTTNYSVTNKTEETCADVAGPLSMGKGKITSYDLFGHFEDSPISHLIKSMRSGELYVSVNTQHHDWPNGKMEILGQIMSGR